MIRQVQAELFIPQSNLRVLSQEELEAVGKVRFCADDSDCPGHISMNFRKFFCKKARTWRIKDNNLTAIGQFIKKKFDGATVVDLGSGIQSDIRSYTSPATRYIGVDTEVALRYRARTEKRCEEIIVQSDMLCFVIQLKDESVDCFVISGIESDLDDDAQQIGHPEDVYEKQLMHEISRALKNEGILMLGFNGKWDRRAFLKHAREAQLLEITADEIQNTFGISVKPEDLSMFIKKAFA